MHLSRQTNASIPQHINFIGIREDDGAIMYFITEKQQKKYYKILFRFINCDRII